MSTQTRRALLMGCLALLLWGPEIVRRGLWEPDEARVALIAREMRTDGRWFIPHRHGEIYGHKPPLIYWLINAASTLTGLPIGPITVRLPGLVAGLATIWLTAQLALRWRGPTAVWPSVLVLCTNYLVWHEVAFGRMDALLLGLTTAAYYALWREAYGGSILWAIGAYVCMGLGLLTKGPVGLLVPIGAYVLSTWAAGDPRRLVRRHWFWGPWVSLAFPATWLVLAWWQGAPATYFHELLWLQTIHRAGGALGHKRPFYYLWFTTPAHFLPWTCLLPAAWQALGADENARVLRRRLVGWAFFVVAFFSSFTTKRDVYVLGAFPALALLVGCAWDGIEAMPSSRAVRGGLAAILLILIGLGAGVLVASFYPHWPIPPVARLPAAVSLTGGIVLAVLWRRRGICRAILSGVAVCMLLIQSSVGAWVYPALDSIKTPVGLAPLVQKHVPPDQPILLYRIAGEILAFYAERRGRVVNDLASLAEAMREQERGIVIFESKAWDEVANRLKRHGSTHPIRVGNKRLVAFVFEKEGDGAGDRDTWGRGERAATAPPSPAASRTLSQDPPPALSPSPPPTASATPSLDSLAPR